MLLRFLAAESIKFSCAHTILTKKIWRVNKIPMIDNLPLNYAYQAVQVISYISGKRSSIYIYIYIYIYRHIKTAVLAVRMSPTNQYTSHNLLSAI